MKRILITGGAGFIGHHFCEHVFKNTDWEIVVLDKLTYAGKMARLRDTGCFNNQRTSVLTHDFVYPIKDGLADEIGPLDYIVHMGAETHVDRSIQNPEPFVFSNVVGTMRMLDFARTQQNLKWFVMFSTDEVYGPAPEGFSFAEWDRYNATNPYAATKAGAEQLALSYANSYKLPLFITNTMNAFGERQDPEKFIPLVMRKVLKDEVVQIHAYPDKKKSGSRFYIHARNIAEAIMFLLNNAEQREKYNITGEREMSNLDLAAFIAKTLGKKLKYEMIDHHSSRPGHDLRYALDGKKLNRLGFKYPKDFESALTKTIQWGTAEENLKWLEL